MNERFKVAVTPQWSTGANTLGVDTVVNLPNFDDESSSRIFFLVVRVEVESSSSRFHQSAMRPPPEALSAPLNTHVSHDWLICSEFTWKAFFRAYKVNTLIVFKKR